jgi:DNA-binding NtrC family response regulator
VNPGTPILLVDDERPLLKMMSAYLRRMGYEACTVESTEQAWAEAEKSGHRYCAAVVDATMKGLSAEDLGCRLLEANGSMCVILASGYPVDMSVLEAAAPGRVHFLQKPFSAEMLTTTLRRLIGAQEKDV